MVRKLVIMYDQAASTSSASSNLKFEEKNAAEMCSFYFTYILCISYITDTSGHFARGCPRRQGGDDNIPMNKL